MMGLISTLTLLLFLILDYSLAQKPDITVSRFSNLPARLFYFEDTSTAVYHDIIQGVVYVSDNEGKAWKEASGVPKGAALLFIPHPQDNRVAFILSKDRKHYRTSDRGKSWQSFEMPVPPAYVLDPLTFHSDKSKYGSIMYLGTQCEDTRWGPMMCTDETYYTKDAFATSEKLLGQTTKCQYAHSSADFKHSAPSDLIFCVAFDPSLDSPAGHHSLSNSRLFSSEDFFKTKKVVDFGIGERNARGVIALGIVSKFAVAAVKATNGEMSLYVTTDAVNWAKAKFPHASSSELRENGYTIVESTKHSLGVDVMLHSTNSVGTFFVSNSNGTYFVESLRDTNRNDAGFVDFETVVGLEGVGIANVVGNAREFEGGREGKRVKSYITFDDGSNWSLLRAPSSDHHGKPVTCNTNDLPSCSLHLYSVTTPHNFGRVFSSPAPGIIMGVGSIGDHLLPYEQCDTFLSRDAGITWIMVHHGAHKYEVGDVGSVVVIVDDEHPTDHFRYSWNEGKDWTKVEMPVRLRAKVLTTVPDSTSLQFMLIGVTSRDDNSPSDQRIAVVHLDFAKLGKRKCGKGDMERWEARTITGKQCLMGHKQWYNRRKQDADCYVGEKFQDPIEHEDSCPCTDEDYECDYNFVRSGTECVPVGPEPIPAGQCVGSSQRYMGSSGWRLIPGNTCTKNGGVVKDEPVSKECSKAQKPVGQASHQMFEFPSPIVQHSYFKNSQTILVRLQDLSVWQSSNEGFSWENKFPNEKFLVFYMHPYSNDRAYLLTGTKKLVFTTDTGRSWNSVSVPLEPNRQQLGVIAFHPRQSDWLIWTGSDGCTGFSTNCHAEAFYTDNHGRKWNKIDSYVRTCTWARDSQLKIDEQMILCESYKNKQGNQDLFGYDNPLELIAGGRFYRQKTKLFDSVVGFAKFSEYLIVAELPMNSNGLSLQVSLDGHNFATGLFPPNMRVENHAYTILESSTDSVFLHLTMSTQKGGEWGNLLKSNSNGTYYSVSLEYVNRNEPGYVDFEKMIGLDGIALINVVSNPAELALNGKKVLQSRITHNDGGSWKPLTPPKVDSLGQPYSCTDAKCGLHIHGFTERYDVRATYSSPSIVGLMMGVGNVGEGLAPYTASDTFLSRDAGFTWEEIHKDAHLWEFGDSGSVLVIVNDEEPTDHVSFSLNEGLTWTEYKFTDEKIRVRNLITVSSDTSRKFVLLGQSPRAQDKAVAVHLDFSQLTTTKCKLLPDKPGEDDFELWSPSEEREEKCLFGRQVIYHRRIRDRNCYVGDQQKTEEKFVKNCECTPSDFECEFNYVRNSDGNCVLSPGATALTSQPTCSASDDVWYERTAYRRIPHSSCDGGPRPDRGAQHYCPGSLKGHGFFFWLFVLFGTFSMTVVVGWWFYRQSGMARGTIRLPESSRPTFDDSGPLSTLASVPWFVLGLVGIAWSYVSSIRLPHVVEDVFRPRRGYRNVPVDEDAQVLRFEDDE